MAKKPNILFLDEPTGALDEMTGRQVLDYICRLKKQYHFTIVMVTHNLNIAEMAKTVIRMGYASMKDLSSEMMGAMMRVKIRKFSVKEIMTE